MGSLLAALDEESLDNQRDVVKNERRQRYDNVPYGTAFERMTALVYPEGHPYHHTPIGSMADLDAATLDDARAFFRTNYAPNNAVLAVVGDIDPEQTLAWVREVLRLHPGPRRQGAAPRRHAPRRHRPRGPRGVPGGRPGPRADGRVPAAAGRHARMRRGRAGAHRPRRRRVVPAVQPAGAARPHRDRGRLRAAAAGRRPLAGLAGREGVRRREDRRRSRPPSTRSWPGSARRHRRAEEMERAQALLEREWLDRLGTVAGRADELCRYAVLFGDPQLAFTAVQPDPRRHCRRRSGRWPPRGCARTTGRCWSTSRDRQRRGRHRSRPRPAATVASRKEPGGDRCSGDHGLLPAAGRRAAQALGVPRARARRPGQRADRAALPPARPAGGGREDLPGRAARRRARRARRYRHDHGPGAVSGHGDAAPPRSSQPNWSAAARRSTRAPTTRARVSRWRCPSPAWPRRSSCWPRRCARPPSPPARSSGWCATVSTTIPIEMANPGQRAAKQLSAELFPAVRPAVPATPGHRGHRREDRRGGRARVLPGSSPARPGDRGDRGRPDERRPGRGARRHARQLGRPQRRAAAARPGDRQTTPDAW